MELSSIGQGTDRAPFYANLITIVPYIGLPEATGYGMG
jgi:hypothetical protein